MNTELVKQCQENNGRLKVPRALSRTTIIHNQSIACLVNNVFGLHALLNGRCSVIIDDNHKVLNISGVEK